MKHLKKIIQETRKNQFVEKYEDFEYEFKTFKLFLSFGFHRKLAFAALRIPIVEFPFFIEEIFEPKNKEEMRRLLEEYEKGII